MLKYCTISDLRHKEVINLYNGMRLGFIYDVKIDLQSGMISAVIIPGALRFFGILGRYEDIIIPWEKIDKIGDDIVIINYEFTLSLPVNNKKTWFKM